LLFVGVRGSGEDPSQQLAIGTTVYPVYAGVRSADPRVVGYGWPYNAERPGITELRHAAAALDGFLNARARHCPTERIILAGYSAGAQIVGDALQGPALTAAARGRVAAAVLLADPEFNPTDRHTAAGTFDPRYSGAPRRPAFVAPLASRIRSYCRRHDIVCQRRDRAANKNQHGSYVPQQTCQATNFIERTADLRRTKS
jgi:alpha-beta hydrolase superfamily lysophospholipase